MSNRKKRNKGSQGSAEDMTKVAAIYEKMLQCQVNNSPHPFGSLLKA
jgi:hypothetical protein